jgi:hypothetical protein
LVSAGRKGPVEPDTDVRESVNVTGAEEMATNLARKRRPDAKLIELTPLQEKITTPFIPEVVALAN